MDSIETTRILLWAANIARHACDEHGDIIANYCALIRGESIAIESMLMAVSIESLIKDSNWMRNEYLHLVRYANSVQEVLDSCNKCKEGVFVAAKGEKQ